MAKASEILFRIFYSTTFTIIFVVLIAFICVSPADTLYESYRRRRLIDIFLVAGIYVLTALLAILIYASRLFTNRSVLKDIPKTYMPIEKGDLPTTRTSKFVSDMLVRSAVIAFQAKPRSKRIEYELPTASARILDLLNPESGKTQDGMKFQADWGTILHPGWSSPAASDLPNLQYENVVAELTDLVEAKAVSLAPVDPLSTPAPDGAHAPSRRVLEALTRPDDAGMRKYISQLKELEIVSDEDLTNAFIISYERARFAPEPISETEFQTLMRMFAELLRSMKPANLDLIDFDSSSSSSLSSSDNEDENDNDQQGKNPRPFNHSTSTFSSANSNSSVIHLPPRRVSEDSAPSLATDDEVPVRPSRMTPIPASSKATSTRHSSRNARNSRRFVSANSRPQFQRQRSEASLATTRSDRSGRSMRSGYSNAGSVIVRLNDEHDELGRRMEGALPYTIEISPLNVRIADD